MTIQFKKASRGQAKLKMALEGPAGMGKTYSALQVARGLVGPTGRIAILDTEAGSSNKYAHVTDFDVVTIDNYHPDNYVAFIDAAAKEGYAAAVIDSLSHAWMGKGGVLEQVDNAAKRSKSGNSFTAWKEGTPLHDRLMEKILQAPIHIIATMRQKTEYVIEEVNGRKQPRKIGMGAVQRDGTEFLFDVVGEFVANAELSITKTRYSPLANQVLKPSLALGEELGKWLSDGPAVSPPEPSNGFHGGPEYVRLNEALELSTNGSLTVVAVEIQDAKKKGLLTDSEVALLRSKFTAKQGRAS